MWKPRIVHTTSDECSHFIYIQMMLKCVTQNVRIFQTAHSVSVHRNMSLVLFAYILWSKSNVQSLEKWSDKLYKSSGLKYEII